jgi:fructose-1,6-bisphosphatase/inositol monophosphatase family enzyme
VAIVLIADNVNLIESRRTSRGIHSKFNTHSNRRAAAWALHSPCEVRGMDIVANDDTPESWVEMLTLLRELQADSRPIFARLRASVKRGSASDVTLAEDDVRVDIEADTWLREWISQHFESGIVQSEERKQSGALEFGFSGHGYHFVIDPLDGLDNFVRGLSPSAFSLAILPRLGALSLQQVDFCFLGDTSGTGAIVAARGCGAFADRLRLQTSQVTRVRGAIISREFSKSGGAPKLAKLHRVCGGIRSFGCMSHALSMVATGALDAHIDATASLTPEGLLAASLLVTEAGGHLCTLEGNALAPFRSLQDTTTLIAAASQELAEDIVAVLAG